MREEERDRKPREYTCCGKHHELPQLDTHVEAEERDHDRTDEELLQITGEAGPVHQPEHSGEEGPAA